MAQDAERLGHPADRACLGGAAGLHAAAGWRQSHWAPVEAPGTIASPASNSDLLIQSALAMILAMMMFLYQVQESVRAAGFSILLGWQTGKDGWQNPLHLGEFCG